MFVVLHAMHAPFKYPTVSLVHVYMYGLGKTVSDNKLASMDNLALGFRELLGLGRVLGLTVGFRTC